MLSRAEFEEMMNETPDQADWLEEETEAEAYDRMSPEERAADAAYLAGKYADGAE